MKTTASRFAVNAKGGVNSFQSTARKTKNRRAGELINPANF